MSKGHLFGLSAGAGVSLSFPLEEAGRWHERESGRGLARAGSSTMVSIRACRGTEVCRSMYPVTGNIQVKSASEELFTAMCLGCVLQQHRHNVPGRELPPVSPLAASALSKPGRLFGEGCVRLWQRLRGSYRDVPNLKLFFWPL